MSTKDKLIFIVSVMLCSVSLSSCKKYLDIQPDKKQSIPNSLNDCKLLLDDYETMNSLYPGDGEAASDNYYVTNSDYEALQPITARENYVWMPQTHPPINRWSYPYKVVYISNQVLQILSTINVPSTDYNTVKGTALFFRAFALFQVAQLFAKPYDGATAATELGIPIRLSPDLDTKSTRATIKQSYDRIIEDLREALSLLPVTTALKTRPNKVSAFAMLARVYLSMEDYSNAGKMADECLKLYNTLINYNSTSLLPTASTVTSSLTNPSFARFNNEVIFHALTFPVDHLGPARAKIDAMLYNSYSTNDLRKQLFFRANTGVNSGTFSYRGSYDGLANASMFIGLATDEMYLIRAEYYARSGDISLAMADLNTLIKTRWSTSVTYPTITANSVFEAIDKILAERRKELIFRCQRWTDLRRLNKESRFAVTLVRNLNTIYTLPPNDLRYTLLIPEEIISTTDISQNAR